MNSLFKISRTHQLKIVVLLPFIFMSLSSRAQQVKHLSLAEAVNLGVENSNKLKLAESRVSIAKAKYEQLKALQYPQVKAFGTYSRYNDVPEFLFPGQTQSFFPNIPNVSRYGLSLYQPVSGGFRAQAMLESGRLLMEVAGMDAEKDRSEIKINLISAYINLYKLQESLKLIIENLKVAESRLKDVQNLANNGLAPKNDLLRAELQVSNVKLTRLDAENAVLTAAYNFNILVGLPEGTQLALDAVKSSRVLPGSFEDYVEEALAQRPEQKAAAYYLKTAQNSLKVSKALYFPVISLNANYLNANPNQRLVPLQAKWFDTWDFGVSLTYDLTGLFTNKHQVAEAKAQIFQGRIGLDQTHDQIRMEVNQQYLGYKQQLERLVVSHQAVEQATENYRVVKNKYNNQVALLTELLDADTLLLQAQLNETFSQADAELAYQKLLKSTGNL